MLLLLASLLAVFGLGLCIAGAWLALLGGSWFYMLLGAAFLLDAYLLYRRRGAARGLFSLIIFAALAWAFWEVGLDWWQLASRGGVIVLLGLWLGTPWIGRKLKRPRYTGVLWLTNGLALSLAIASMFQDPYDISGQLNAETLQPPPSETKIVADSDWPQYGRTPYGQRYSPLDRITPENVSQLELAWSFQTGDVRLPDDVGETTYQVTPIKVGASLYLCTPHNLAIALDAASGKEKWRYDANSGLNADRQHQTCRGVTYWHDTSLTAGAACSERIYLPTADARLIALDALTGKVCASFADQGTLHLDAGMLHDPAGYYYSTSPPVAVDGKLIIGGAVNDNYSTQEQSGVIRAFDIDSGKLVWNWDAGNPESTKPIDIAGGAHYVTNSPNSWSVFSVDQDLGLVYIPLGNQTPDQLGMNRSAAVEKYSSSIVALNIKTGNVVWVRQTVHHDLWDMDVPAQPALIDLAMDNGVRVPALVGPTKQGDIYVLDRRTGEPVLPIREEPAPTGAISEDVTSPTQPLSALTFSPPPLAEKDMWGITLFDQLACRIAFHRYRYEGRYTPPSLRGSIIYPGNFGVFNWGSVAVDPVRQIMFGMPTYLAFTSQLVPASEIPPRKQDEKGSEQGLNRNDGAPYGVYMGPFLSPLGIPCQTPPWGYVAGADLRTGQIAYKHRNGTVYDMSLLPLPLKVGVPGIGGPIMTKSGLAFLGAAVDNYLRAYDVESGRQLWQARLPAGGQSTPMTYEAGGRQFVIIVAGGHGSLGTTPGDYVQAFSLPPQP